MGFLLRSFVGAAHAALSGVMNELPVCPVGAGPTCRAASACKTAEDLRPRLRCIVTQSSFLPRGQVVKDDNFFAAIFDDLDIGIVGGVLQVGFQSPLAGKCHDKDMR